MERHRFEYEQLNSQFKGNNPDAQHDDGFQHKSIRKGNLQNIHGRVTVTQAAALNLLLLAAGLSKYFQRHEPLKRIQERTGELCKLRIFLFGFVLRLQSHQNHKQRDERCRKQQNEAGIRM